MKLASCWPLVTPILLVPFGGCCLPLGASAGATCAAGHATQEVPMEPGQVISGFALVERRALPEIDAVGLLFEHQRSGARLLKLQAADDNKVFCITFKTLPPDDSGVPHILEHAVLNGSKNFPAKSPFTVLTKGSLNTFLNAMTAADHTMYPVASRNNKDFFNLMHVYLDAVFYPRLYEEPLILAQEGWHYHLESATDELGRSGVVLNEMKGAFSSPERELYDTIYQGLFPDTVYANSSGGRPEAIPTLTQERFVAFHQRYYHPSNSYILLYGDGDTAAELAFIDERYLRHFERAAIDATVPLQRAFTAPAEAASSFPLPPGATPEHKTYLALSFVAGEVTDPEHTLALEMLGTLLVDLPGAPLRRALVEAGIGQEVSSSVSDSRQPVLSIIVQNADVADKERFRQVVYDTLRAVVAAGLDKKAIEGVLNTTEFRLREADYGSYPKGLVYNYFALPGWLHAGDPFRGLAWERPMAAVRQALGARYFEPLIERWLLGNPHALLTVVAPKAGLAEELVAKERAELARIKQAWSTGEVDSAVARTAALEDYQKRPDDPAALATIPLLALADIDRRAERFDVTPERLGAAPLLRYPAFTGGIVYLQLAWDAGRVPAELVPYVALLSAVLGELGTAAYDYGALDTEIKIHTGGIGTSATVYSAKDDTGRYSPRLMVSAKVLAPKFDRLLELLAEMLLATRYDDERLSEVIHKLNAGLQAQARNNGIGLATSRLAAYVSAADRYAEELGGLRFHQFVGALAKDWDGRAAETRRRLAEVAALLLRDDVLLGVTCADQEWARVKPALAGFVARLAAAGQARPPVELPALGPDEGLLSGSKVQYVIKGADYRRLGQVYDGRLLVTQQVLSREYLQSVVREQGGAYGAWAAFGRNGLAYFGSYRDPNLTRTLEAYEGAADFLASFAAEEREMTRFIIGTIARLDRPLTPRQKGEVAVSDHLRGLTGDERQAERDQVLATTAADIRAQAPLVRGLMQAGRLCVFGNEKVLRDNAAVFKTLVPVGD